ncbi:dipeptidase [Nisaea sediminum]|uniref:dipeptidase n=1 Tax=Nisaea sediminum TaxID=2775867 RepID=UPI001868684F|nr:membrane dipeptidase [Nisaea sediminum]
MNAVPLSTTATTSALVARFPWLEGKAVCDGLWPWSAPYLPAGADLGAQTRRYRAAGFTHVSFTAASGQETEAEAMINLGILQRELQDAGIVVAHDAQTIRTAQAAGHMSASFHFQSATPFARSLDTVEAFLGAGIQRAILAYNEANIFADGCHETRNAGLSARGHELVRRMDATGMRIDLTHCSARTSFEVLEMDLKVPPLFSHSNARAIFEHERNISDDQIRAAAAAGCYIGVNGVGFFLGAGGDDIPGEMARHAAHIAAIAGADHIGIGLDFMYLEGSDYAFYHRQKDRWPRGYPTPPWSFFQPEQLSDLVEALLAVGFDREEVTGILGKNYLRLAMASKRTEA